MKIPQALIIIADSMVKNHQGKFSRQASVLLSLYMMPNSFATLIYTHWSYEHTCPTFALTFHNLFLSQLFLFSRIFHAGSDSTLCLDLLREPMGNSTISCIPTQFPPKREFAQLPLREVCQTCVTACRTCYAWQTHSPFSVDVNKS